MKSQPKNPRSLLHQLASIGASVIPDGESTRYSAHFDVRMPDGLKARLSRHDIRGWRVRVGGCLYRTYSVRPTLAVLRGEAVTPEMLSPRQREAFDAVAQAPANARTSEALGISSTKLQQLESMGLVVELEGSQFAPAAADDPQSSGALS